MRTQRRSRRRTNFGMPLSLFTQGARRRDAQRRVSLLVHWGSLGGQAAANRSVFVGGGAFFVTVAWLQHGREGGEDGFVEFVIGFLAQGP
jgi:hypothetical protein